MKDSKMQVQKIMNFLYGDKNSIDKIKLETEINLNPDLKKELELQKEIDQAIQNEIRVENFMSQLDRIHEKNINAKNKVFSLHNKWYYAAASITLVAGTTFYTIKQHFQNPDHLYNKFYEPWQPGVITRGASNNNLDYNIISDFQIGKYENVIKTINNNFNSNNIDPKLLLVKGCAEMELMNFTAAINTLKLFESKNYTFYTEAAQWYLALCYLKNNDANSSKIILNKIVESNTSYAVEASKLLKKLN